MKVAFDKALARYLEVRMKAAFDKAVARYLEVVGEQANYPTGYTPGAVARNGWAFLRNRNGLLAAVTPAGKVFDHIGGERLDDPTVLRNRNGVLVVMKLTANPRQRLLSAAM